MAIVRRPNSLQARNTRMAISPEIIQMDVVYFDQQRMLCTPFAGQYQFFDAKTTFYVVLGHKKHVASENLFRPVNDVRSTHSLVKIHNKWKIRIIHLKYEKQDRALSKHSILSGKN